MNIEYLGEHLWFGKSGHLFVILSFVFSFLSSLAYYFSFKKNTEQDAWRFIGRLAFRLHSLSIAGIVVILFYILSHHYFEYYYVWEHSSLSLPFKYLFACFWEGQEGSFLLWAFWNTILSFFIIRKKNDWESPVMTVVSMVQVFLSSMLLGIYFFGYKVGSDPFILLRDHPDMAKLPFISMPDYLSKIADGRGLNPLLQNYWMVIHPPILFLGFASTLIPFAFATAALLTGKVTEWVKPAIPWTLFGVAVLGTGILMGAAWAYEALSFGGFWAWDPVENASLVPWLILVSAAHVLLIQKSRKQSLFSAFLLCLSSFLLVLYSTFLTRSGILGDASVHAFTDLGMSGQLLLYMGFFLILSAILILKNRKTIFLKNQEEEEISSREFWMFIGMLVLVISSFQITLTTSVPVINKLFDTKFAPPVDAKAHYNAWQLPIAVILSLLIALGQFFKWKTSDTKEVGKKLLISFSLSMVVAGLSCWQLGFTKPHYIALFFSSAFACFANADYFVRTLKGKMKLSGSSMAHVGFGLILIGVLISNAGSKIISQNHTRVDLGKDFPNNENVMLVKNDTVMMGDYLVTYKGKIKEGVNIFYEIEYFTYNWESHQAEKDFILKPVIQTNPRMGNVSEPDTRHFLEKDIYTHITYAKIEEPEDEHGEYKQAELHSIKMGDTLATSRCILVLKGISKELDKTALGLMPSDLAVGADMEIINEMKSVSHVTPVFIIRNNFIFSKEAISEENGLKINFTKVNPETGKFEFEVAEKKSLEKEFVIMKAIIFPGINILWTGSIIMVIGTLIALRKRILKNREPEKS